MATAARSTDADTLIRFARLLGGGLLAGLVGGVVAGLGARLIMFVVRVVNPSFNGGVTHNGVVNGQWTSSGTMAIVVEALFLGILGGWVYFLLRPLLVGPTLARGVEFGALLLVVFGSVVLDGDYEFTRFVPAWQSVSAFAALYVLYGVVVALIGDRAAPVSRRAASGPGHWAHRVGTVAVAIAFAVATVGFVEGLRFRYGF